MSTSFRRAGPLRWRRWCGSEAAAARSPRHRVYLDIVPAADVPDDYEQRLVDVFPGRFDRLRLLALEAHDLALSKLSRNQDHDRQDVRSLARTPGLDVATLQKRYTEELRWKLGSPARGDLTIELWVDMIREVRS